MMGERETIHTRVANVVAGALDVPVAHVTPDASLIDDLGAESIDFLDIQFRLESEFGLKISETELWQGAFEGADPSAIDAGVKLLRERRPGFRWDRLPAQIGAADLPRLITLQTIVDYLERRTVSGAAPEVPDR